MPPQHGQAAAACAVATPQALVSEIVYFPTDTQLLRAALAAGCRTVYSGTMAAGQAVRAFISDAPVRGVRPKSWRDGISGTMKREDFASL